MKSLFLSPHCDDESLFGAFTILRERPVVAIVFDSYVQPARGYPRCSAEIRRKETWNALRILMNGCTRPYFMGFRDDDPDPFAIRSAFEHFDMPDVVYAPAVEENGHPQHNMVGQLARDVFPHVVHYMTYTRAGKSTGRPVPFEPEWPALKLKALACYESQIALKDNVEHFLREQHEYYQA